MSKCNACWSDLEGDRAVINIQPSCSHIFCIQCINRLIDGGDCTLCSAPITKKNLSVIPLEPSELVLRQKLVGLAPAAILTAAHYGRAKKPSTRSV